jgi:UDP:flavonoid glycosyltransferase YjiC (YdhE family)
MLALPLALDQPAVAGHLERLHCAVALPARKHSVADIRQGLEKIRSDESYRESAQRLEVQLQHLSGTTLAADVIETEWNSLRQRSPRTMTAA